MKKLIALGAAAASLALVACTPDAPPPVVPDPQGQTPTGLDPTFHADGEKTIPLSATQHDRLLAVAAGPGNGFYAAGYQAVSGSDYAFLVAKFDGNGNLDGGFGTGGVATVNVAPGRGTAEQARSIVVQPDGKIVIAGPAESTVPGIDAREVDGAVVRFNTDGTPDGTFGVGGIATLDFGPGRVPVIQPDGVPAYLTDTVWGLELSGSRIVVFGSTPAPEPLRIDSDYVLAGLTTGGVLDPTFGTGGTTRTDRGSSFDSPRNLSVDPEGRIVAAGYSTFGLGFQTDPILLRYDADGQPDATFGVGGIATTSALGAVGEAYKVGFQSDGSYVVSGYGRQGLTGLVDVIVFRFTADGEFDGTFGTGGVTRIDVAGQADRSRSLVVLPDDRILSVGAGALTSTTSDALVTLVGSEGIVETSFNGTGKVLRDLGGVADSWYGAALADDGTTIWIAGYKGTTAAAGGNDDAAIGRVFLDY